MPKHRKDGKPSHVRTHETGEGPMALRSRDHLYNVAKEMGIRGRGHMSRAELLSEIDARMTVAAEGTAS